MLDTLNKLEKRLWDAANALRANSKLKSSQYSTPVLGLIILRYADYRFSQAEPAISQQRRHWRKIYAELIIILVVVRTVRSLDCRGAQQRRKACLYCYAEKRVTWYRSLHRGFQHAIFAV